MPPGNLPGPTLNSAGNLPKSLASNRSLRKRPGAGLTSTDHVRPETIGDLSYGVSAGLRFITGEMFSSTLSYSFNGSDKSENHAFMLNTSWKF